MAFFLKNKAEIRVLKIKESITKTFEDLLGNEEK